MADAALGDAGHAKPHHDYHLVNPSPGPVVGSLSAFIASIGGIVYMKTRLGGDANPWILLIGFAGILYTMYAWWTDVVHEAQEGDHTPVVRMHHRYGLLLFIASEVMFFVAWFWAYFNFSIFHSDYGYAAWPPNGITTLDPWHLPLLNTVILLTSGTPVTWAHHALQHGDRKGAIQGLILTVLLGLSFTACQAYEYAHAPFTFGFNNLALQPFTDAAHVSLSKGAGNFDAIYGSTFFMA